MRKIKLLFVSLLSMMAWTGVMAQTDAEYEAALNAIKDGGNYRISTVASNATYYVTTDGGLTATKANGGIFTITKVQNDNGYNSTGTGFRISSGAKRFTNPPLTNNVAALTTSYYATSDNTRTNWEAQILFLNAENKYAIRSCNTPHGTSSWEDAGRTFWTWKVDPVTPQYSYDAAFVWDFEEVLSTVNVTYKVMDGTTQVASLTVVQDANSAVVIPASLMDFKYDYSTTETVVGDGDCDITVYRTMKPMVHTLADLSNSKAYYIACDRGKLLTKDNYLASTAHASLNSAEPTQFAVINYESHYYFYSIKDGKFVTNTGALTNDLIADGHGVEDAINLEAKSDTYFLAYFTIDGVNNGLNTNGNDPYGYVINTWMNADAGNQYFMIETGDFDATNALTLLEAYFHPAYTVTYVVKEGNTTLFTSEPQPIQKGATITALPDEFKRTFYTYEDINVTISEKATTIDVKATWAGPFVISENFDNAHWYDMAMRKEEGKQAYYVTSAVVDGDGAYKTQLANTMGLVEDSYQWAFLGNGYDGFKVINKKEGAGKSFGWTDATATNAGVPTIMDDATGHHAWKIVPSTNTSVPANSFCLNVPGTNLYINQYGGAGGSLKFWNSANNVGDPGSAFTVFDVPSNFAPYVVEEIAPAFDATGYFAFTAEAKAALGWDEAYKTECSFEQYKSMKEGLAAAQGNLSNFVLPETGYYILKNKYYSTYMGMDPSDLNLYGNYQTADKVKNIVKLTKNDDNTYTISLEGVFAPATVGQSAQVTAAADNASYTVAIPTAGYAAFSPTPNEQYSYLHCAGAGGIVGWEAAADASKWEVIDAEGFEYPLTAVGDKFYATAYFPCPVTLPQGVTAYVGMLQSDDVLTLIPWGTNIAAETAVILEGTSEACPVSLYAGNQGLMTFPNNALKGSCIGFAPTASVLTLQVVDDVLGFYTYSGSQVPANKAYIPWTDGDVAGVKIQFGEADGINGVINAETTGEIFNVAGQRLAAPQKGINIINGKKVLVK